MCFRNKVDIMCSQMLTDLDIICILYTGELKSLIQMISMERCIILLGASLVRWPTSGRTSSSPWYIEWHSGLRHKIRQRLILSSSGTVIIMRTKFWKSNQHTTCLLSTTLNTFYSRLTQALHVLVDKYSLWKRTWDR